MKNKSVFILNYASHYRISIFKKINNDLNADFYFGDIPNSSIKKIDYKDLSNFKKEFKTIKIKSFFWYKGSHKVVFQSYQNIILTGDPQILSNWLILILAQILRKKTYLWTHGLYGKETKLKRILKKIYFGLADRIFLYGDYAKNLMINDNFDKNKLIPLYNSLNYAEQLTVRNNLSKTTIYTGHFGNNNPVLIYIGRIQKVKRLDLILHAMEILNKQDIVLNLVIVGGCSKEVNISNDIKKHNLEKQVWLYGSNYDEKRNGELIYNSDICISPGNVGLTAIHSLMYGTPVITHNNFSKQMPEFETIVENYTGGFFEENNVDDLSLTIKKILNCNIEERNCHHVIDTIWNPDNQIQILKKYLVDNS